MKRAIHGAPAEALRQALEALAGLSFWISWTADPDLAPEPVVSARCMRDAAKALRKAARLLDEAADRADPPPDNARRAAPPVSGPSPDDASGGDAGQRAADARDPQQQQPEAEPSPSRAGACRPERAVSRASAHPPTEIRMNHIAPPPEPAIRDIPLCQLALAPENVRKTPPDEAADAQLIASIKSHGLLENLVARPDEPAADGAERFAVVAGGRRLAALVALVKEGWFNALHPVPCKIAANGDAGELSLAENVVRIAMHPADQVVAFSRLAQDGATVAAIAARFGVTERLVEQRLRLGNAAPELLDAYRADEIDLETLKAFSVTTDHDRQRAVWEQVSGQGYRPSAWQVKRMLTEERVPAGSPMARFVGVDAYEGAGGPVLRDLFADEHEHGVWLEDPALLIELAMKKLQAAADELATRWKWAEPMVDVDWSATARYGRIHPEPGEPTDEEKAEIEKLRARHDELVNMDEDQWTDELVEEAEAIEPRLDAIEAQVESRARFKREDFAMAGCIATIGRDGSLQVIQGLVKPEDMPKPAESDAAGAATESTDAGDTGPGTDAGRIAGPAMSTPAQPPKDREAEARKEAGVGIGLADDLRSVRTALVKAHLAEDFEAAFDLTVFQLVRAVFARGYTASWHALDIAFNETADRPTNRTNDDDFAGWSPGEAMLADWSHLPFEWMEGDDDAACFAALRALPRADKEKLFAARGRAHGEGPARLRARRAARARSHRRPPRHRLREARPAECRPVLVAHQEEPHPRHRPRDVRGGLDVDPIEVQEGRPREVDGGGVRGRHAPRSASARRCTPRRSPGPCRGSRRSIRAAPTPSTRRRPPPADKPAETPDASGDATAGTGGSSAAPEPDGAKAPEGPAEGNGHDASTVAEGEGGAEPVNGEGRGEDRPADPSLADAIDAMNAVPTADGGAPRHRADGRSGQRRGSRLPPAGHPGVPAPRPTDRLPRVERPVRTIAGRGASFSASITESAHERHRGPSAPAFTTAPSSASPGRSPPASGEVFSETLQNSRRAGATRIRVAIAGPADTGPLTVTVTDDGAGIVDPAVLLSFGENGWSEDLVRREDAAGMGMLSLARRGCTVSSRSRATSGEARARLARRASSYAFSRRSRGCGSRRRWRTLGRTAPPSHSRRPGPRTPSPSAGPSKTPPATIRCPSRSRTSPTRRQGVSRSTAAPSSTARSTRSAGAASCSAHSRTAWYGFGLNDPDVNFHGLTVSAQLPRGRVGHRGVLDGRRRHRGLPRAGARAARAQGAGRDRVPRRDARGRAPCHLPRPWPADPDPAPVLRGPQAGARGRHRHRPAAARAPALAPRACGTSTTGASRPDANRSVPTRS